MKIEAWDLLTNSWKLCHENVNNEVGDLVVGMPNNQSGGMNKIRYTFRDFANLSNLRISQLFLVNYISEMGAGPFLPRGGGQIYGPILDRILPPAISWHVRITLMIPSTH